MPQYKLSDIGWTPFFEQQRTTDVGRPLIIARVSAHHGSEVLMLGESGEFRLHVRPAEADGKVAVGDWLEIDVESQRTVQRFKRRTLLTRNAPGDQALPQLLAANIDTVFIVSSCNEDFNLARIERYLALTLQAGATPIVVLTKADMHDSPEELKQQAERLHDGLLVVNIDTRQADQVAILDKWCGTGQTVALLGSSGVGKSTLANTLGASGLATGAIRESDGKGRHTTTARSLHMLPTGGILIDNPGIRELQLPDCNDGIEDLFEDVVEVAATCKFRDCRHEGDPGCAIAAAIASGELDQRRFESFQKLVEEQARSARTKADRHKQDRSTGKMYKAAIDKKRRRREDY